jgi:hypothetical protein
MNQISQAAPSVVTAAMASISSTCPSIDNPETQDLNHEGTTVRVRLSATAFPPSASFAITYPYRCPKPLATT